jgi:hypothetical protein
MTFGDAYRDHAYLWHVFEEDRLGQRLFVFQRMRLGLRPRQNHPH